MTSLKNDGSLALSMPTVTSGITAGIANSVTERSRAFEVRHAAYCKRLMACNLQPTDPHDAWDGDEFTTIYVVRDGSRIVGSTRVIHWDSPFGLQANKFIDLLRGSHIEASRVALDPHYEPSEARRFEAHVMLLGAAVQDQWAKGHFRWVQTMRRGMALLLSELAIPFEPPVEAIEIVDHSADGVPLKDPHLYLGYLDLRRVAAATYAMRPDVYQLMFGTTEPLVPLVPAEVDELRALIGGNISILRG